MMMYSVAYVDRVDTELNQNQINIYTNQQIF